MKEKIKVMMQKQAAALIGFTFGGAIIIIIARVLWGLIKFLFITHA